VIHQVWGPLVNLVGDGGYRALRIGGWFVMKYSNIVMYVIIAGLFVLGMFVGLPERGAGRHE